MFPKIISVLGDIMQGKCIPNVVFKTRVRDETIGGSNPYRWQDLTSIELFKDRRVIVFSLPGAFTPTCDTYQLPGFEKNAELFKSLGIQDIYCVSVNDAFVMNAWAKSQKLEHVKVIPDGSGLFTRLMGQLVNKDNLGFGQRSWRYAMIVNNGVVEAWFEEPGREDNCASDPYNETSPENLLRYLQRD